MNKTCSCNVHRSFCNDSFRLPSSVTDTTLRRRSSTAGYFVRFERCITSHTISQLVENKKSWKRDNITAINLQKRLTFWTSWRACIPPSPTDDVDQKPQSVRPTCVHSQQKVGWLFVFLSFARVLLGSLYANKTEARARAGGGNQL